MEPHVWIYAYVSTRSSCSEIDQTLVEVCTVALYFGSDILSDQTVISLALEVINYKEDKS